MFSNVAIDLFDRHQGTLSLKPNRDTIPLISDAVSAISLALFQAEWDIITIRGGRVMRDPNGQVVVLLFAPNARPGYQALTHKLVGADPERTQHLQRVLRWAPRLAIVDFLQPCEGFEWVAQAQAMAECVNKGESLDDEHFADFTAQFPHMRDSFRVIEEVVVALRDTEHPVRADIKPGGILQRGGVPVFANPVRAVALAA